VDGIGWGAAVDRIGWGAAVDRIGWGAAVDGIGWGAAVDGIGWGAAVDGIGWGAAVESCRTTWPEDDPGCPRDAPAAFAVPATVTIMAPSSVYIPNL
jgi:hypothetical protein